MNESKEKESWKYLSGFVASKLLETLFPSASLESEVSCLLRHVIASDMAMFNSNAFVHGLLFRSFCRGYTISKKVMFVDRDITIRGIFHDSFRQDDESNRCSLTE
jgi:hypothetical protein